MKLSTFIFLAAFSVSKDEAQKKGIFIGLVTNRQDNYQIGGKLSPSPHFPSLRRQIFSMTTFRHVWIIVTVLIYIQINAFIEMWGYSFQLHLNPVQTQLPHQQYQLMTGKYRNEDRTFHSYSNYGFWSKNQQETIAQGPIQLSQVLKVEHKAKRYFIKAKDIKLILQCRIIGSY